MKPHRIKMAHNLIVNYGLDKHLDIIRPTRATPHKMTSFHTDEYIDFLSRVTPETVEELTGRETRYLIGTDCPAFEGLFEFCAISAGGSIAGAQRLNTGLSDIAVNWAGGLHHAKKREASGFCYVNDIVLAILEFLRVHARVLYIDIDVHHGDGVEEAFYTTDRVMTCSFHKFGDFFPGTGDLHDRGIGKGKGYSVNVPLRDGIDDDSYRGVFRPVIQAIMDWYRPGAVILQCGADSLAEDKLGSFNLSMKGAWTIFINTSWVYLNTLMHRSCRLCYLCQIIQHPNDGPRRRRLYDSKRRSNMDVRDWSAGRPRSHGRHTSSSLQ